MTPSKAGQAGAEIQEIEITPEMIEAGVSFLWSSGRWDFQADGPDQLFVRQLLSRCLGLQLNTAEAAPSVHDC